MRRYKIEDRGITLWEWQRQAVDLFLAKRRIYLHFDLGMGKTITALACALECNSIKEVLVLAPLSAQTSWYREIERVGFDKPINIMTYETFLNRYQPPASLNHLLIVFDEAHRLKNWKAKTTRKAYMLFRNAPYKIMLSGTMADKAWDIYAQFKILLPERMPMRWKEWLHTFFIINEYNQPVQPKVSIQTLLKPFEDCILVKNKTLSIKIYHKLIELTEPYYLQPLDISDSEVEEGFYDYDYDEDDDDYDYDYNDYISAVSAFMKKYRRSQLQKSKFHTTLELLKEDHRYVVFVHFRESVAYYRQLLGDKAYYITGQDKKDLERALKYGDKPIITTYSLKEGVNLQTFYNKIIYHTLPLAYRDFKQSYSRVYRPGQESDVIVYYLKNAHMDIDQRVGEILKQKRNVLTEIKKQAGRFKTW